jgi:hypothetical protein
VYVHSVATYDVRHSALCSHMVISYDLRNTDAPWLHCFFWLRYAQLHVDIARTLARSRSYYSQLKFNWCWIFWKFSEEARNPGREGHYPCKMVIEKGKLTCGKFSHGNGACTRAITTHSFCLWLAVRVRSSESCECKFPCGSSATWIVEDNIVFNTKYVTFELWGHLTKFKGARN